MIVCQFPPVFLIMVMSVSKFGYETTSQDTSGLLTDSVNIFLYSLFFVLERCIHVIDGIIVHNSLESCTSISNIVVLIPLT